MIATDPGLSDDIARIASARSDRATLVALSGIDGSGKTTLARALEADLATRGLRVALIHLDPWHHPARIRFGEREPGVHFYTHAFRWSELFDRLIDPLVSARRLDTVETILDPSSGCSRTHHYLYRDIDVVLLEGIFLLRRDLRLRYDLAAWLDCDFSAALRRALLRNQEGLSPRRIILDYETIYFPAQRHHLAVDDPIASADRVLKENGDQGTPSLPPTLQ